MLPIEQIKALMKVVAKASNNASAPVTYSHDGKIETMEYRAANEALRQ